MTVQEPSASSVRLASTALPDGNVIPLPQPKPERTLRRPFTKTSISKMCCPAGKREALFWDASCRGFGLRALPSGHRSWIYQYRNEHKGTRRITLGDVTAVPLEAARRTARQLAAKVTQGSDPSAERKDKQAAASVLSVVEAYLQHAQARQRPRSFVETKRHLRKHAAPLHHERAEAVCRSDVAALLERVSKSSGPSAANRCRAALSSMWSWGLRTGLIRSDVNPVAFTIPNPERARDRTLNDAELRAIWSATAGGGDYDRIVRLCILTGCRREEIGGLQWDEVLEDRLLIGAGRMKAGEEHEVPLLPAISELLPAKTKASTGQIFGRNGTGFSGWSKSKAGLDTKMAEAGNRVLPWTLHDLRRTFSTRPHDAGVEPIVIEALLAHKQHGVAAVYNRASFRNGKRAALERWHVLLQRLIEED